MCEEVDAATNINARTDEELITFCINLIHIPGLRASLQILFVLPTLSVLSIGTLRSCDSCVKMAKIQLAAMVLSLLAISSCVSASKINVRSQCPYVGSACDQGQGTNVTCYALQNGESREKDVGASWAGGVIWGFPNGTGDAAEGNNVKPQANLAEFTIGANGQDYYDLCNVNAHNLPLIMGTNSTNGTATNGTSIDNGSHCGTIKCSIPDLESFCKAPNGLTGPPGNGCYNKEGTGNVPTNGTEAFKDAWPSSYSYSVDDKNDPPVVTLAATTLTAKTESESVTADFGKP